MQGQVKRAIAVLLIGLAFLYGPSSTAGAAETSQIEQLQKIIDLQQQQLKAQQRQLEEQKRHLEQMQGQINSLLKTVRGSDSEVASAVGPPIPPPPVTPPAAPATPPSASAPSAGGNDDSQGSASADSGAGGDQSDDPWPAPQPQPAASDAQGSDVVAADAPLPSDLAPATSIATDATVKTTNPRIKVTLSGQINRAINVVNDGEDTDAFFVDNDVSDSRFRFVAEGKFSQKALVGSVIEVAVSPNNSEEVSQTNQDSGDFIDLRKVEVYFDHQDYGRIWLGKGSTSSDNTAEVDLSGTDVVQYSGVADIVGGILFREKSSGTLSDVAVNDAFFNFDGLSRKDRVRYDTPAFWGFQLSGSAISDGRYDGAVLWAGQVHGFNIASAFAASKPSSSETDFRLDGSASMLHTKTGLNLTLAGGMDQLDDRANSSNLYAKVGWLADTFDFGSTAFGLDFTRAENIDADGDQGHVVGGAVVQRIDPFGTELFAQVRWYTLDRGSGPAFDDIVAGTVGARVQF
ncbi:MAG: hypothetical protein AAF495_02280 [Pseudomonadota bacterium]